MSLCLLLLVLHVHQSGAIEFSDGILGKYETMKHLCQCMKAHNSIPVNVLVDRASAAQGNLIRYLVRLKILPRTYLLFKTFSMPRLKWTSNCMKALGAEKITEPKSWVKLGMLMSNFPWSHTRLLKEDPIRLVTVRITLQCTFSMG